MWCSFTKFVIQCFTWISMDFYSTSIHNLYWINLFSNHPLVADSSLSSLEVLFLADVISSKLALCVFYLSHPFLYPEFSHSDDGAHTLDPHWWRVNKPSHGVTDAMLDHRPKESWLKGIFKMKLKSHGKIAWRPLSIKGAWKGEKKADVCCCFVAVQPLIINQCVHGILMFLLSCLFVSVSIFCCLPLWLILIFPSHSKYPLPAVCLLLNCLEVISASSESNRSVSLKTDVLHSYSKWNVEFGSDLFPSPEGL